MTPERQKRLLDTVNKRQVNLTVVLEGVEDPRNISAVMRSCESVGIQDIHVVKSSLPTNKTFSFKSGRSASKWLTVHEYETIEECFTVLRTSFDKIYTTQLGNNAISLYDINFTQSVALVFGSEVHGISSQAVALADGNFIIPQVGFIQSLNISVACAVSIYEAYRQKNAAGHYDVPSLPESRRMDLLQEWMQKND